MIWYGLGTIFLLLWLAWKFFPVGEVHGRRIMLGGLMNPNTRLQLAIGRAKAALQICLSLSPHERLSALLKVEERFGDVFLAGDDIRQAIVATGVDDAIKHFSRILDGSHGRISVTAGVRDALKSGAIEENYKVQAFKFLVDGLDSEAKFGVCQDRVPELLLRLDKEWALRILRSPEYLAPDHKLFRHVLCSLNERGLPVNRALVESWLPRYHGRTLGFGEGLDYVEVLTALHAHDAALSEQLLEKAMREQPEAAERAGEALLEVRDLPHPTFSLDDLRRKFGLNSLNATEKTVWLTKRYTYMLSYGLEQFEVHEENELIMEMRRALQDIGALKHAAKLDDYISLYGPAGVPTEYAERKRRIEAHAGWDAEIEAIRARHNDVEDADVLLLRFELDHADAIRKRSEIQRILNA